MAKKEKAPLSESLLTGFGIVSFVGLTGYLFYYDPSDPKAKAKRKKRPWKTFFITLTLTLLAIAALVGAFWLVQSVFFPSFVMPQEWIALIGILCIILLGSVVAIVEYQSHQQK